jgi:hypothetical protein
MRIKHDTYIRRLVLTENVSKEELRKETAYQKAPVNSGVVTGGSIAAAPRK